jgi:dihydrodipicolinate synthase/N-acetylneuraminate lyase
MKKLKGVIVPVAVPMETDTHLNEPALARLVEFLLANGAHGLFANGSMGAFAMLADEVQLRVISQVTSLAAGRTPVLAGASDTSTTRVLAKIRAIQELPVDAIVLLPPYYYMYQQKELLRFFLSAADHSQKPIILYENPKLVPNSLAIDTILELSKHPNVHGIKFSSPDVLRWQELLRSPLPRERFSLISGAGRMTALALQLGFDGITEGLHNIVPNLARSVYDACTAGDYDLADRVQQKINRCFRILEIEGGWRGLELAFQYMGIADKATIHPFDIKVEDKNKRRILDVLRNEGILQPYPNLLGEEWQTAEPVA